MTAAHSPAPLAASETATSIVLLANASAGTLRALGSKLTARFGLEHSLTESGPTPVLTLLGHLDQGERTLRLTADRRPGDGDRLWVFYLDPADEPQPIAEADSPDLVALVMRARKARM